MTEYRNLTNDEIDALVAGGSSAADWSDVMVAPGFEPRHVVRTRFSGRVRLGVFEKSFELAGGVVKHSGINNATLHNVEIGHNCCIENVNNYIANYRIGEETFIENADIILTEGETAFGNGVEVSVLNETGGREVIIHDRLSAQQAYLMAMYRHRPDMIARMREAIERHVSGKRSAMGTIGRGVRITDTGSITNVYVGDYARIEGTRRLHNGSLNSVREAPVHIGYSVVCVDFIVSSGSKVEDGTALTRVFVGQACTLGHNYSASDSLFFGNCQEENGEACAIFAGPFTVTHHKSTLLIAGQFSFMNAGSGSNQSNHMYKLGPIHQGVMERGAKTTSDSYILWPARIGAFSLVMGRHTAHPDTSNLPFSYLIEEHSSTYLVPGVNLQSVGTMRDAKKWPERDLRRDPDRLDQINYNLLSPYTIQKMLNGSKILRELRRVAGETSEIYSYQSAKIKSSSLRKGLHYYELATHKFLGNSVIKRLEGIEFSTNEDIRRRLRPDTPTGQCDWTDLSGLIAPKTEIARLMDDIESRAVSTVDGINDRFADMHRNYYTYEWTWAYYKMQAYYGFSADDVTASDIVRLVHTWSKAVAELDDLVYADAKKEFSLSSMTSFGADGNREQQELDFEQVRGDFDNNPTVLSIVKHKQDKAALGQELINRLKHLCEGE